MSVVVRKKETTGIVPGLTLKDSIACNEIIDRLKLAANVKNDTSLASALGLKQSSVSTARTNGIVPPSWIVNGACLFNVSSDWLICGSTERIGVDMKEKLDSSVLIKGGEAPPGGLPTKTDLRAYNDDMTGLPDLALDDFERLWDEFRQESVARRGWLQIELMKKFPEFLLWLKKTGVFSHADPE
ncbi:hypothetical protein C4J81_00425 [Deltaproteobacteria bacterium Smac51]|nr:hypothetical protein C4J81_00425 [Deltaproteobacteria bacterium Smac51]